MGPAKTFPRGALGLFWGGRGGHQRNDGSLAGALYNVMSHVCWFRVQEIAGESVAVGQRSWLRDCEGIVNSREFRLPLIRFLQGVCKVCNQK